MKKIILLLGLLIFITAYLAQIYFNKQAEDKKSVRQITVTLTANISPTSIPTLIPTLIPTPFVVLKKASYSIAVFGDSMVDTMGEKLEYLQQALTSKYPQTKFDLYNYGIGGQNIEQGLGRFESSFLNRERNFPPIPVLVPDVLIIGSFAYNPFSTHDRNKHYTLLKELVAKAKNLSSNVYLLAEIAPLGTGFGKGKNGVNMSENAAFEHATRIIEQLDDVINLSKAENIPLINAYYESRFDGSFGNPEFVNEGDGIHPSVAGNLFTAELIAANVKLD